MKKIEDYLHLYIGCECYESYNNKIGILSGLCIGADNPVLVEHNKSKWWLKYSEVKPMLRPLSDITEEECDVLGLNRNYFIEQSHEVRNWLPLEFKYLLKQRFDFFGLIPSNLAIDKTKIETK